MDWVGVVVGGDDPRLAGLTVAGLDLTTAAAGVLEEIGVPRAGSLAEAVAHDAGVLVLDAHCPLAAVADVARVRDAVVAGPAVGVRPVTDTVKRVRHDGVDLLGETVDREALVQVAAPLVAPARLLAGLEEPADVAELLVALRRRTAVGLVEVGPSARRVADPSDLALLVAG